MARPPRRHTTAIEQAEALFKSATTKPAEETPRPVRTAMPVGKETVSVRLDRDVLEHFQDDGPGWQDRINAALRKAAGLS
ncbi:BrnA antitoxin family protein [Roseibium sp.]|uniref:BrnA antitoxin family protein n=1 Tax=Roseibium sp. TaxID=1936156 RepID=UPI003264C24F